MGQQLESEVGLEEAELFSPTKNVLTVIHDS